MRWVWPALLALGLAACSVSGPVAPPSAAPPFDAAPFRAFLVPRPLLPFEAEGAAQLRYRGERESGSLSLQAYPGGDYRLTLHTPLTGGVALELRVTPTVLRVIDYVDRSYLLEPNTAAMRRRLFEMDLSPSELQTLLTGRVVAARFHAGGGRIDPARGEATFREDGALHRFQLDADGLPLTWVKERAGAVDFRVEFREYLALPQGHGAPLRLPRKVRLSAPDGVARLVLGLHTVRPGAQAAPLDPAGTLPDSAARFAPAALPTLPTSGCASGAGC